MSGYLCAVREGNLLTKEDGGHLYRDLVLRGWLAAMTR